MSKSRGNFLDPHDVVAAFGAGRGALRDAARGRLRQGHRGLLGLVRPALQRGPRERLRQPPQPDAVDDRPLPGRRAPGAAPAGESPLAEGWPDTLAAVPREAGRLPAPRRARGAVGVRGRRQQTRRRGAAVDAGEGGQGRRRGGGRAAARGPRRPPRGVPPRGDGGGAVHALDGAADPRAARHRWPYGAGRQRRPGRAGAARVGWRAGGRPGDRDAARRCSRAWTSRPPADGDAS